MGKGHATEVEWWSRPQKPCAMEHDLFGKLTSFIGQNGPRQTGIPLSSSVADVWRDGVWIMQSARSPEMEELLIYLTQSPSTILLAHRTGL
ncbi:hypothetical protein HID58_085786 [Brassica napus]|uniref:Uncharacterized protein n=1 Tax=Brassica napus TaxID=3708 RepID=A0ABQ7XNN1_BRANA|nr:hypothetical protein HID58_085786 [Brassica napus]